MAYVLRLTSSDLEHFIYELDLPGSQMHIGRG